MSFFDLKNEIAARFITAAEFGFEPHWWGCLVQSVNCCQMLAGVEPILLSHNPWSCFPHLEVCGAIPSSPTS
jgi:hypothetical protein